MCQACEEMQLFYAYLDAMEEAKRKALLWECEVTVLPQESETAPPVSETKPAGSAKSGFTCDELE